MLSLIKKYAGVLTLLLVLMGVFAPIQLSVNQQNGQLSVSMSKALAYIQCKDSSGNITNVYTSLSCPAGSIDITNADKQALKEALGGNSCGWLSNWDICASNVVYALFVGLGSALAYMGAYVLDVAAQMSLSSSAYALDFLSGGWTVVRDIANMSFIFILVYIALKIMFEAETTSTVKMLAWVVVVAVLVNFSFFFTRVIIDAGNIVAVQFYNAIPTETGASGGCVSVFSTLCADGKSTTKDLTGGIMKALGVQVLLNTNSFNQYTGGTGKVSGDWLANLIGLSFLYISVGAIFWILFITFLGVGIKFIVRIVVLWFTIVASPLAFVARTMSGTKTFYDQWQKLLISHSIYPAVFLFVFLMLSKFIGAMGVDGNLIGSALKGATAAAAGQTDIGFVASIAQVIGNIGIRVGIVVAALYYGSKLADKVGVMGGEWAGEITGLAAGAVTGTVGLAGRAAFGGAGFAGRQLIGRPLNALGQSEAFKNTVSAAQRTRVNAGLWRGIDRVVNGIGSGSFDIRNAPGSSYVRDITKKATGGRGINVGSAQGKGGYAAVSKEAVEREERLDREWKQRLATARARKDAKRLAKINKTWDADEKRLKELDEEVLGYGTDGHEMPSHKLAERARLRERKTEKDILANRVEKFNSAQVTTLKAADVEGIIKQISEAHLKALQESNKYSEAQRAAFEKKWHEENSKAPMRQAEKQLEALNKIHEKLKTMDLNLSALDTHARKPAAGTSMVINLAAVDAMHQQVNSKIEELEDIKEDEGASPAERTAAKKRLTRLKKASSDLDKLKEVLVKVPEGVGGREAPAEYERKG